MREFDTGATRDTDEDKLDYEAFLSPLALERYAQYLHKHRRQADGKMRDSDNWQKGLPIKECVKSMFRHFVDLWRLNRGYCTEDIKDGHFISIEEACCAIIFNAFAILHEKEKEKLGKPRDMGNIIEIPNYFNTKTMKHIPAEYDEISKTFAPTQYGGDE